MEKYEEFENKFRDHLFFYLKGRTGAFLNYVDQMLESPGLTLTEARQLEQLKKHGKSMFMECQNEILTAVKCLLETGELPRGIDKRATKVYDQND